MRTLVSIIGILLATVLLLMLGLMLLVQTEWFKQKAARQISEQLGREVEFAGSHDVEWSLRPLIRVRDVRLANAPWAEPEYMFQAEAIALRIDLPRLARGQLHFRTIELESPRANLARANDGRSNWDFLTGNATSDEQAGMDAPEIDQLLVENGQISYQDAGNGISLDLVATARKDAELIHAELNGSGSVAAMPVELELAAEGPDLQGPMRVDGMLELDQHRAELSGNITDPIRLQGLAFALTLAGPDPQALIEKRQQQAVPAIGDYRLSMHFMRDDTTWRLRDLRGHIGDSQLEGGVRIVGGNRERPFIEVDLSIDALNLDARGVFPDEELEEEIPEIASTEALRAALDPLRRFDAEVRLRIGEMQTREIVTRDLDFNAHLQHGRLEMAPVTAGLAGGELSITAELEVGDAAVQGALTAEASPLQLSGLMPEADAISGVVHGQLQLRLTPEHLLADTTELHVRVDSRALAFRFEAGTRQHEQERLQTQMRVVGVSNDQDFVADLVFGPLLRLGSKSVGSRQSIYARLRAGDDVIVLRGDLEHLLTDPTLDARFSANGPDIDAFGAVWGMNFPTVPPFDIHGRLMGGRSNLQLRELDAQIGDSDFAGEIDLRLRGEQPPFVRAMLRSSYLNLDTFTQDDSPETLPDTPSQEDAMDISTLLNGVDGEFDYRSDRVDVAGLPLEAVVLRTTVGGTRLELQPLEFQFGGGTLLFTGVMEGRESQLQLHLEGEAERVRLSEVLMTLGINDASEGFISGALDVDAAGVTTDAWLSSAVGELRMLMTGGQVDRLLAEFAGEDLSEQVMEFLLPEDAEVLDLDCAHLAVDADAGVLVVRNFFVTTPNINVIGEGAIDLERQTLDLTVGSEAEDPDLLDLLTPVDITGPWSEPEISVLTGELLARVAAALTLGAVLAPGAVAAPAALTPLLAGLGEEATPCHEVVEQAEAEMEAVEEE